MIGDDDDFAEDRPEELPVQRSVDNPKESRKRARVAKEQQREVNDFIARSLGDPGGRRFIWGILRDLGTFEERYGFGPTGFANNEATWAMRGQKDFGLRLYHTLSIADRAGTLSLLDEHHPHFPKPPAGK